MSVSRFFVVRVRPDDLRAVRSALYGHTRVAALEENVPDGGSKGQTVAILETTTATAKDADYLVTYQSDRLRSFGSFFVTDPFDTYPEAESFAGEEMDAYPEMTHTLTPAQHLAREFGDDVSEWEV